MKYLILVLLLVSTVTAKVIEFDYADFNPKYRNFNSYFENLEENHISEYKHGRLCNKGTSSYNYNKYFHDFCKGIDYSHPPRTAYRRYNTITVRYI